MAETFKLRDTVCPKGCPEGHMVDAYTRRGADGNLEIQTDDGVVPGICNHCQSALEVALTPLKLMGITSRTNSSAGFDQPRRTEIEIKGSTVYERDAATGEVLHMGPIIGEVITGSSKHPLCSDLLPGIKRSNAEKNGN